MRACPRDRVLDRHSLCPLPVPAASVARFASCRRELPQGRSERPRFAVMPIPIWVGGKQPNTHTTNQQISHPHSQASNQTTSQPLLCVCCVVVDVSLLLRALCCAAPPPPLPAWSVAWRSRLGWSCRLTFTLARLQSQAGGACACSVTAMRWLWLLLARAVRWARLRAMCADDESGSPVGRASVGWLGWRSGACGVAWMPAGARGGDDAGRPGIHGGVAGLVRRVRAPAGAAPIAVVRRTRRRPDVCPAADRFGWVADASDPASPRYGRRT
jgi:hypothetical protein